MCVEWVSAITTSTILKLEGRCGTISPFRWRAEGWYTQNGNGTYTGSNYFLKVELISIKWRYFVERQSWLQNVLGKILNKCLAQYLVRNVCVGGSILATITPNFRSVCVKIGRYIAIFKFYFLRLVGCVHFKTWFTLQANELWIYIHPIIFSCKISFKFAQWFVRYFSKSQTH